MTPEQLQRQLDALIAGWEGECVEFKDANDNYSTSDIGKYFSALANEANLRARDAGWLVFGVNNKTRKVIGTDYRKDRERLHSLKHQIAQNTDPSVTLREIHELETAWGRVILFEIPPAPRGIPIAWNGHYYAREGESLGALDLAKLDEIRGQGAAEDWSAVVCPGATLDDLDPEALAKAREIFLAKHGDRIPAETIRAWDDATFLDQARLTFKGGITRATLLLLGRPQATPFFSPYVAELTWKLEGPELAYEHFHPPFLLETSRLFQRIRNLRLSFLPPGQLIPVDVPKYDQRIVLEALHNCIAHQDYRQCERVLVIERVGELEFQNAGRFYDGTPEDYILGNRSPSRYRNRFLAEAMAQLRMIDTMGFGIREVMFRGQARRYLPLPDYDLSDPGHVVMRLAGRFIDENYSRALLTHGDFSLGDILALDKVQKGVAPDEATLKTLRKRGLVEGRKPAVHVSASVAKASGREADYILARRQDDAHYRQLILDYLQQFQEANREKLRTMLANKWPAVFTEVQKENKLHNLLAVMKREGIIERIGGRSNARWRMAALIEPAANRKKSKGFIQ
jgi:ATP-dependent DNA helicase RecG